MKDNNNETWKEIDGISGYLVSDRGQIKSLNYKRTGKPQILKLTPNGIYLSVNLKGKLYLAHRLVAAAFVPNPNNYSDIKFKNGDTRDIDANNLEWVYHNYNKKFMQNDGV